MSRIRIVGGKITKTTEGAHHMYSEENIFFTFLVTPNLAYYSPLPSSSIIKRYGKTFEDLCFKYFIKLSQR